MVLGKCACPMEAQLYLHMYMSRISSESLERHGTFYFVGCKKIPTPSNGKITYEYPYVSKPPPNSKATFSCRSGYELNGNKSLICLETEWSGPVPQCKLRGRTILYVDSSSLNV